MKVTLRRYIVYLPAVNEAHIDSVWKSGRDLAKLRGSEIKSSICISLYRKGEPPDQSSCLLKDLVLNI